MVGLVDDVIAIYLIDYVDCCGSITKLLRICCEFAAILFRLECKSMA